MSLPLWKKMDAKVLECFSESYTEAREKFRDAAKALGAEMHCLEVTKDEQGNYTIDVAILRGTAPGLMVHSSGTHGVEGYCGSGMQTGILRLMKEENFAFGPTLVLIHSINPYGMAHFRRWNENGVDLNRNAIAEDLLQKLAKEDKLQETYMAFDAVFNPASPPNCFTRRVGSWLQLTWNVARHGVKRLKTAMVAATYSRKGGIFYGGQELQTSHKLVRDFMTKNFGDVAAKDVGWVDVHTGLGPQGIDVILGGEDNKKTLLALFPKVEGSSDGFQCVDHKPTEEIVRMRCEERVEIAAEKKEVSQSEGYEYTVGVFHRDEWVGQFFKPNSGTTLSIGQEFGTEKNMVVARALIFENSGYQHDRKNHEFWRAFTRDAFYTRTSSWKERVLTRGHDVLGKMAAEVGARAGSK